MEALGKIALIGQATLPRQVAEAAYVQILAISGSYFRDGRSKNPPEPPF